MSGPILQPIEGNEDSVRSLAAALTAGAAKLSAINAVLVNIKAGSTWDSPAGELFEQSVRESPPLLDALVDRYAGAAAALRDFAGELGREQASAQRAIEWRSAEYSVYRALDEQMASRMSAGEPWDDLLTLQNQVLGNMNQAQRRHADAWQRFDTADRRLAHTLRVLADDILDDSWHYAAVAKVQGVSTSFDDVLNLPGEIPGFGVVYGLGASKVPLLGQVMTATAATRTASTAALKVFYGEGSWKEVGVNAAATVVGRAGSGMVKGATHKAERFPLPGRLLGKVTGDTSLAGRERAIAGMRKEWADSRASFEKHVFPVRSPGVVPKELPLPGPLGLRQKVVAGVAKSNVGQWQLATAGGSTAQKMFASGVTLQQGAKASRKLAEPQKPEEKRS